MEKKTAFCVYCNGSSDDMPVIPFEYKGEQKYICAQHLPILIHKPEQLAGKLKDADKLQGG